MKEIQVDLFMVLVATFLNMFIGFLWYSKWFFGSEWMRLAKVKSMEGKLGSIFYGFLVSFLLAYFLALFERYLGIVSVTDGMFMGLLIWIGFVATTLIDGVIWAKTPIRLFAITAGAKLFSILVLSGFLAI